LIFFSQDFSCAGGAILTASVLAMTGRAKVSRNDELGLVMQCLVL